MCIYYQLCQHTEKGWSLCIPTLQEELILECQELSCGGQGAEYIKMKYFENRDPMVIWSIFWVFQAQAVYTMHIPNPGLHNQKMSLPEEFSACLWSKTKLLHFTFCNLHEVWRSLKMPLPEFLGLDSLRSSYLFLNLKTSFV